MNEYSSDKFKKYLNIFGYVLVLMPLVGLAGFGAFNLREQTLEKELLNSENNASPETKAMVRKYLSSEIKRLRKIEEDLITRSKKIDNVITSLDGINKVKIPPSKEKIGDFTERLMTRLDNQSELLDLIPLGSPLSGEVSSTYGYRIDPMGHGVDFHSGLDIRAPLGTLIRATADGKVIKVQRDGGYGLKVELEHLSGLTTVFAHLLSAEVEVGKEVKRGQVIGRVGVSGKSTGPHLHFEVRNNEKTTNPAKFISAGEKLKNLS